MAKNKRIQQLDLNLLRVFQTLYQEQNMTRAAEVLHLTPSAVSHAIKRLRDALDDPLFQRSQNKMVPTAACQRMAPLIIDNLSRLQQILQQWGDFTPADSEHNFRIGMQAAFELSIIPLLAERLLAAAPKVTFSSIVVNRQNLSRELAAGHVDMVIDVLLPVRAPIRQTKLADNDFCVLMRTDHPLATKLSRKSYLAASHLNVSSRPSGMTVEDMMLQQQGIIRQTSIRCQNYFAARDVLYHSDNLLTVSSALAEKLLSDGLVRHAMPFSVPGFSTHLYWHENTDQDAALNWMRTMVEQLFQ